MLFWVIRGVDIRGTRQIYMLLNKYMIVCIPWYILCHSRVPHLFVFAILEKIPGCPQRMYPSHEENDKFCIPWYNREYPGTAPESFWSYSVRYQSILRVCAVEAPRRRGTDGGAGICKSHTLLPGRQREARFVCVGQWRLQRSGQDVLRGGVIARTNAAWTVLLYMKNDI